MQDKAQRLREARELAGYESARQAANANGWGVSTYTAHENGQNGFSAAKAAEYAKAFKTSAEWLMFGTVQLPEGSFGIDAQLRELPKDLSERLVAEFNATIKGAKMGRKLR